MNIIRIFLSNFVLLVPLLLSIIFTILFVLPFIPYEIAFIAPLLGIMTTLFWIVNKPELMSWSSVLIIGLIHDFLLGLTVGLSCISLVIVRYIIIKLLYKYDGASILNTFLYIALGIFIWITCVTLLRTVIQYQLFNYLNVFFQYFLSVTFSPIIILINKYILNKLKQ